VPEDEQPAEPDPLPVDSAGTPHRGKPWRHPPATPGEKENAARAVAALKRTSAREGAKEVCRAQGGLGLDRGREVVCNFPGVDAEGWADEAAVEGWRLQVVE